MAEIPLKRRKPSNNQQPNPKMHLQCKFAYYVTIKLKTLHFICMQRGMELQSNGQIDGRSDYFLLDAHGRLFTSGHETIIFQN